MKNLKNLSKRTLALAMALLMCVGMLNLTAFAAEEDPYICGHEAHVHTDECYSWPELICGQEEAEAAEASEGHTHSADCYEMRTVNVEKKELICDLEESEAVEASEGHTHGSSCYEAGEDVLVCGEEESEEHTHDASCYEAGEDVLVCGQDESEAVEGSEGHTHTDDCYETKIYEVEEETLICGKEESEAVEASEGHTHTDDCYAGEKTLICDKEEHTHTAECLDETMTPEDEELEDEDEANAEDEENPEDEELIPEVALLNLEGEETELESYLEEVGGSITISATDMEGNAVKNENGQPSFDVGKQYYLTLNIYAIGFAPGDYFYQLPDYVKVVGQLKNEIKDGDVTIGNWSIDTAGKVSLYFNKEAETRTHVTAYAKVIVQFTETDEKNTMIGNIQVVINSPEARDAALAKSGTQNLSDKEGNQALYWKIEFTGGSASAGQKETIVGRTLTDTTDGKHKFTSLVEFGVRVDGKDHKWSVGAKDWPHEPKPGEYYEAEIKYDAKRNPIGWSYTIPETIVCKDCGETIHLDDSYGYWATYFSDPIDTAKEESVTYRNTICIEDTDLEYSAKVTLTFKYGGADVSKKVDNYNANGEKFEKKWTIEVGISGVPANSTDKYPAYTLWDHFVIEDANENEIANFNGHLDEFVEDFEVTIDGQKVPSVDDALNAGGTSEYAYLRDGGSIVIGMRYDDTDPRHNCTEKVDLQKDAYGHGYCTCWRETDKKIVTITYYTDNDKMLDLMAQYGQVGMRLVNYIDLNTRLNIETPVYKWATKSKAITLLDDVFDKQQGTAGSVAVGSEVDYTITLNEGNYVLEDDELHVVDNMTGLAYVDGSIKVTSKPKGGQPSDLSQDKYEVDWNKDSATLTITLLGTKDTSDCYTVEYKTKVVGDAHGNAQFSNSASVKMFGKTFKREVTPDGNGSIGSNAQGYSITVLKTETGKSDVKLAGAVFGLYDAETDKLVTTGTTGTDGTFVFSTNTSKKVFLNEHIPYYIKEETAPSGYVKTDDCHYFYFCKKGGNECETCEALKETLDRIEPASETPIEFECYPAGATVTVENEKIPVTDERVYSVKLTKVDAKTRETLSGAVFGLFQGVQNAGSSQIATATTDGNGICTFNSQNEYKLTAHTLYYLQELTAPSGYELNSDPHYFYFCDHAGSDEDTCDACEAMENDVVVNPVKELEFEITVENTKKEGGDPDPGTDPDPKPDTDKDPDPKPNPDPDPRPNPRPDPEPTPEIPDEDVPLEETPDVEIPEEDVPLADLPEIEDEEVPLADVPEELIEIFDEDVPLANVPKTGDNSQIWGIIAALSGAGLVWLALEEKKRKTAE